MSEIQFDVIVVGAGIVGAACARSLARAGQRVLILEAAFAGGGATAAAMGHLVAMDDSPDQLALTALSLDEWRKERGTMPSSVELDECGTIWIAEDDDQMDAVSDKKALYAEYGITSSLMSEYALAAAEPNLREGLAGGLLVPADSVVYPPNAARYFVGGAVEAGAQLREQTAVRSVQERQVETDTETFHASNVVIAAGTEITRLLPSIPVVPRKGHLAITDRYPGFVRRQLVELGYLASAHTMSADSVAFNVQPRKTSQVLVGSSRELVGWDATLNRDIISRMLARAQEFMPALADLSIVRTWTGFRPATPDKLPLIGPWGDIAGVWIAAGHEGLGITTSLGTARVLTDMILSRTPAISTTALFAFTPDGKRVSSRDIQIILNGKPCVVPAESSVAATILNEGMQIFRKSVSGESRMPLCGMGVCYECRATIDGVAQRRACLVTVADGMLVDTDADKVL